MRYRFYIAILGMAWLNAIPLPLSAQVSLPLPGQKVESLIGVLKSDATTFEKAKACQQLSIVGDASAVPELAEFLSHPSLATYARSALENISATEAGQALESACRSLKGDLLIGAIQSIGKRKSPQSVAMLAVLLADDDPNVELAAARALAFIGTEAAADLICGAVEVAEGNRQAALGRACLSCVQQLIAKGDGSKAESFCDRLLALDLPVDINQAANFQKIQASGDNGRTLLLQLFDSADSADFEMALFAARRLQPPVDFSFELAGRFEKQTPQRQVLLLRLLGDLGDRRALPCVLKAVASSEATVREAAINALAEIGDGSCVPVVLDAIASPDPSISKAAVAVAIKLPYSAIDDAALEMLDSSETNAWLPAIRIAAGRKLALAFGRLKKLSENENQEVTKQAIHAMGQVAGQEHLDQLIKMMIAKNDDPEFSDVQQALQSACLRMPQNECAVALTAALNSAPDRSKIGLLEQLAVVGGSQALKTVVAAAGSDDDGMQDAATRLLGEWLTADAAPEMLVLVKTLPPGKYRTRVLRGYIRIARQLSMTINERMAVCRNSLSLADRNDERRLVLAVLRQYGSPEGLAIAKSLLNESELKRDAEVAIRTIQETIGNSADDEAGFVPLFDGESLEGWKEYTQGFWRVEDGVIVGGDLQKKVRQNEFLRTKKTFGDFELRLQFKLTGTETNAGVQFRTAEIPDHHEVSGYQADLGDGWWGCLYDESRRRRILAGPPEDRRADPVRMGEWNDYRIRCQGKRIQLWINGVPTVDYTEEDPEIPQAGIIALQVHGDLIMEASYRNIRIKELP